MATQQKTTFLSALAGLWLCLAGDTQAVGQDSALSLPGATEDLPYTHTLNPGRHGYSATSSVTALRIISRETWLRATPRGRLSGTPRNEHVGMQSFDVVMTVRDSATATDTFLSTTLEIPVENTNDLPQALSAPTDPPIRVDVIENLEYRRTFSFDLYFRDDDAGDSLTLSVRNPPEWLRVTPLAGGGLELRGTPLDVHVGSHPMILVVMDAAGETASQDFEYVVASANEPPDRLVPP